MKEKIAEKIRQARVKQNLSQENIAFDLGISIGAYSNIERGKSEVTVSRLYAIAKVLKIQITELLVLKLDSASDKPHYEVLSENGFLQLNELTEQLKDLRKEVAGLKNAKVKSTKRK